jgi:hypothetical protein
MENPENVGVTGRRWLLEPQNIDSRLVTGKIQGMCELRNKIAPRETLDAKNIQARLEPPPARPFDQLRAGCWQWSASPLIQDYPLDKSYLFDYSLAMDESITYVSKAYGLIRSRQLPSEYAVSRSRVVSASVASESLVFGSLHPFEVSL